MRSRPHQLIATFNPTDATYGFTAIKEPAGDGRKRISLTMMCGSQMLGCSPLAADVSRAFYYYVQTGTDLLAKVDMSATSMYGIHFP